MGIWYSTSSLTDVIQSMGQTANRVEFSRQVKMVTLFVYSMSSSVHLCPSQ